MAKNDKGVESFSKLPAKQDNVEPENDNNIVSKVQEHLKKFGGAKDDVGLETSPTPEPDGEPTDEPKSTPEPDSEPADEPKSTSEPNGKPAADDKGKPAIPDNYYRALTHQGWTPERISKLYEKDSELLLELAEKAHETMNNLSAQFANLGRAKIELERKRGQSQQQPQQPQVVQTPVQQGPDLEKLRAQYEEDPFGAMTDLVRAFTQPQQPQQPVSASQQPTVSRDQFDEELALTQHLISFWGAGDMEPYKDFYGSMFDENRNPYLTADHLTPGQAANRQRMLVEADRIIAGAAMQGENLPIQQALAMAHMVVSAPIAKQIARKELTTAIKKKAKGVTLEPTARKSVPPKRKEGEGKPEKELEKDTKARIDAYKEGKPLK